MKEDEAGIRNILPECPAFVFPPDTRFETIAIVNEHHLLIAIVDRGLGTGVASAYDAGMRRAIFVTSLLLAFATVMPDGLAQDNAPSSAPPPAASVLKVCAPKIDSPCADVPPRVLKSPMPGFCEEPGYKQVQGRQVTLSLVVDKNGLPGDLRVLQSFGTKCDEQAIKTVGKWRFAPATMDGQPVAVEIAVKVNY